MDMDKLYDRLVHLDAAAFEEFFDYMTPRVFSRLMTWGLETEDAEMVALWFVREIAIIAPSEEPTIREMGFEVWIQTVTRNTFVRHWRNS